MRMAFFFLLMCLTHHSFTQTNTVGILKVDLVDCRSDQRTFSNDTLQFYQLPADTLSFMIIRQKLIRPYEAKDITAADYRVRFRNIYGTRTDKRISLKSDSLVKISLCTDSLLEYPQNSLAKFRENDSIEIFHTSYGCAGYPLLKIVITKQAKHFTANLYNLHFIPWDEQPMQGQTPEAIVTLTAKHLADFTRFENELNYLKEEGCTQTNLYRIRSPYLNLDCQASNCSWDGFDYLWKSFTRTPQ